jgi:hypothetical protein
MKNSIGAEFEVRSERFDCFYDRLVDRAEAGFRAAVLGVNQVVAARRRSICRGERANGDLVGVSMTKAVLALEVLNDFLVLGFPNLVTRSTTVGVVIQGDCQMGPGPRASINGISSRTRARRLLRRGRGRLDREANTFTIGQRGALIRHKNTLLKRCVDFQSHE